MSDWRGDDEFDEEWPAEPAAPAGEGVRVVGADPAHPDAGYGHPDQTQGSRFALPDDDASWSAAAEGSWDETGQEQWDQGGGGWGEPQAPVGTELPHWTDPPTGEVPSVLGGGGTGQQEDFDAWSQLPGPRFRVGESDWADEDFAGGELRKDDSTSVGALADDDYAEHDVYAPPTRSRGRGRGRGRGRQEPPPAEVAPGPGGLEGAPGYDQGYDQSYDGGYDQGDPHADAGANAADLPIRVITGVIMAAIALVAFAAGRPAAAFLVTVIVGVCAFEVYEAFRRSGYHTATVIGLLGCVALVPIAYNEGERAFPLVSVLVIIFTFLWYLFEVVHARPTVNVALTLMVFAWIGIMGGFAGLLLAPDPSGTGLLLGVVICAVGSDTVGYFTGRAIGRSPLMPTVSPNKTVEGAIGGAIAAIVLGGIVGAMLHPWADKGIGAGLALGVIVAVTAPIGDLVESMVKRDLGVKDFGTFLPGHGGFLDRFDALLFALPAAYYLALQIFS